LQGSIVEASLDKVPEYFALSYTWGNPELCKEISIDGKTLKITQNCADALRRMLRGKAERLIWVDSICINQAGDPAALEERGKQVALMDEIYRKATQVNVHLGVGDAASDVAIMAMRSL
ncbi:HET-domain-containing protein, partial [Cucurbitaria berberidis CBS 394.84]